MNYVFRVLGSPAEIDNSKGKMQQNKTPVKKDY